MVRGIAIMLGQILPLLIRLPQIPPFAPLKVWQPQSSPDRIHKGGTYRSTAQFNNVSSLIAARRVDKTLFVSQQSEMPGIVGPFQLVTSNVSPLEAHIGHLRHLINPTVARNLLRREFGFNTSTARTDSKLFCAQIEQSLHFHDESKAASLRIRPVLQYYAYLNLAVAAILAYRPQNCNQYRQHGVVDKTHSLNRLDLASKVLEVRKGAVPLFHSILSDVDLTGRHFRLGALAAGMHMLSHELKNEFDKDTQDIVVTDSIVNEAGKFRSQVTFKSHINNTERAVAHTRLEEAMPMLAIDYTRNRSSTNPIEYMSNATWPSEGPATRAHRKNCLKLINYGGHLVSRKISDISCRYSWRGVSRTRLLPTLTSLLLFSFSLASLVRYRPALLNNAMESPYQLLVESFVQESDAVFFPALRNLLYRQEVYIGLSDFA